MIIKTIQRISHAPIVLCTQYNPFPSSSIATVAVAALNRMTEQMAKHYHVLLAPTHRWFEGRQPRLIVGYQTGRLEDVQGGTLPVHPNNLGHLVIAQGLIPYIGNQHAQR
jgi:lysophospholipase L1-like esterase